MSSKRVFVTGSSRGIGRAIALTLAKAGWSVATHYVHSRHESEQLVRELGDASAGAYQADLGDPTQVRSLFDRVVADGKVDAIVNNAGVYVAVDYIQASDDAFAASISRCLQVNFEAPAWLTRAACKHFLSHGGGKVVQVASRVGHRGEAGAAPYSASKAALLNLTKALAVEHAKLNIQHYAIAPGWVETSMGREGMKDRMKDILDSIPLGRMATPADCAAAVKFLLSDEASYLSGAVIDINGASYIR